MKLSFERYWDGLWSFVPFEQDYTCPDGHYHACAVMVDSSLISVDMLDRGVREITLTQWSPNPSDGPVWSAVLVETKRGFRGSKTYYPFRTYTSSVPSPVLVRTDHVVPKPRVELMEEGSDGSVTLAKEMWGLIGSAFRWVDPKDDRTSVAKIGDSKDARLNNEEAGFPYYGVLYLPAKRKESVQ